MHNHQSAHDRPAVHGMLLVGESRPLLSHLPMFHAPHDYQLLLEVALRADAGDPFAMYVQDRRATGEKVYTWVPGPFSLSEFVANPQRPLTMTGTIFRGHFERGGVPITPDTIQANVQRVLFSRRLDPRMPPAEPRYLLFGSPDDAYLAHLISCPPDFDQVLRVDVRNVPSGWDGAALMLRIDGAQRVAGARLKEGDTVEGVPVSGALDPVQIVLRAELYFETSDLAS